MKVAKKQELRPNLAGSYKGIDDMYKDSDYVVSGVVKDIEYFDFAPAPFFSVQKDSKLCHFYTSTYFFFELRGPPAINKQFI